jgi:hypothetical protein
MDHLPHRHTTHSEIVAMTENLIAEYAGRVPAGRVIACVARSREQLLQSGVRDGLVPATEAAARVRLSARVPAHSVA